MVRRTQHSFPKLTPTTYYSFTLNFCIRKSLGDLSDGGTPGHIPNPVVKAVSADGTWRATSWESRSLPRDFFSLNRPSTQSRGSLIKGVLVDFMSGILQNFQG